MMATKEWEVQVKNPRFVEKDIAASRFIWWRLRNNFHKNYRSEYRSLIMSGLRPFLSKYYASSKASMPRRHIIDVLLHIKLRYIWAKQAFDGGDAYKETDALIDQFARIGRLADELASECENLEALFLLGDAALNLERLAGRRDSLGKEHLSIESFVGGLMLRVCIDCTVLTEGLSDIAARMRRPSGRPPVISNTYLILTGIDLYKNVFQLGEIVTTAPKNPTRPEDYEGFFFDFIRCYTALLACEDFRVSKQSTGFGSSVMKIAAGYRRDPSLPEGLNPDADIEGLLLSTNALATLSSPPRG